jgi:hypothetical protein
MSTWHQRWLKEAQELARWGMPKKYAASSFLASGTNKE